MLYQFQDLYFAFFIKKQGQIIPLSTIIPLLFNYIY